VSAARGLEKARAPCTWGSSDVIALQQFAVKLAFRAYRCGKWLKTLGFFLAAP